MIGQWAAAEVLPVLVYGGGVALFVTAVLAVWAWREHRQQPHEETLRIGMEQTVEMPQVPGRRRRRTRKVVRHQQCTGRTVRR